MLNRARSMAWIVFGCFIGFLFLEALLRALPVDTGLVILPVDGTRERFMRSPPHWSYTYSHGWSLINAHRGATNNVGIVNSKDWSPGERTVLIMGDSYIVSRMNDYGDTLQGRLETMLPVAVRAISAGGANAADYLEMAAFARQRLDLAAVVIRIDLQDFLEGLPAHFPTRPGHGWFEQSGDAFAIRVAPYRPSPFKELASQSAVVRYLHLNLGFDPVSGIRKELATSGRNLAEGRMMNGSQPGDERDDGLFEAIDYFLSALPQASGLKPDRVVFLLDCDRLAIYGRIFSVNMPFDTPRDRRVMDEFAVRAGENGSTTVSLCEPFETYVRSTGQRLDYSPLDYHWNGAAHALAAEAVARHLRRFVGGY